MPSGNGSAVVSATRVSDSPTTREETIMENGSGDLISRTELLMTYIRGLEPFVFDPEVAEIMVVPHGKNYLTFVERQGVMDEITEDLGMRESHLAALARDIARNQLGREIDEEDPALSTTLE